MRKTCPGTTQQIALLGNRELEAVLLELLEDIVCYPDGGSSGPRLTAGALVAWGRACG